MSPDDVDALLSPSGAAVLAAATAAVAAGGTALAVGTALRREHDAHLVALAMSQLELRERARGRLAHADDLLLTREGLEQASSSDAATWKARRYAGLEVVADLCCGIGGDLMALAPGREALAVDRDPVHLTLAAHNATATGADAVTTVLADVRDADLTAVDAVHLDPARRRGGTRTPDASEPPLPWAYALAERVPAVGVKAAPGLDVASAPAGWEVEFVAEGRALTQAVLWSPALARSRTRAVVLPGGDELVPSGVVAPVRDPGRWLVDPSPAVTRAGAVADLAELIGGWQVDPQIAFLCSDTEPVTPFGRSLRVDASLPWDLRRIRAVLRERGIGTVDIRRRGLAGDVEDVRRALRLHGDARAVLLMTRVRDAPWAFVCTPAADSGP